MSVEPTATEDSEVPEEVNEMMKKMTLAGGQDSSSSGEFNPATAASDSGNPDPDDADEQVEALLAWVKEQGQEKFLRTWWWEKIEGTETQELLDARAHAWAWMYLRGSKWRLEKAKKKLEDLEDVCRDHVPHMRGFGSLGISVLGGSSATVPNHIQARGRGLFTSGPGPVNDAEPWMNGGSPLQERLRHYFHDVGVVSAPRGAKDRLGRQLLIVRPGALAEYIKKGGANDETAGDRARNSLVSFVGSLLNDYEVEGPLAQAGENGALDDQISAVKKNQASAASVGFVIVLDMLGAPYLVNRAAQAEGDRVQKCLPARVSAVYVIDPPWFFKIIMAIISKFTSSKLLGRLKIVKREQLAAEFFEKEQLPVSLGGTLAPSEDDFSKPPLFNLD